MAVGDITFDAGNPHDGGGCWRATGIIEADNTLRAFNLTSGSIIDLSLVGDNDAVGIECQINEDAAGTATNGTAAVQLNVAEVTQVRFNMLFTM